MKQLEVKIMGQNYLLGCPENGDQRLLEAVGLVDTAMCRIRDAGKVKARDRIAVLAALNLAFEITEHAQSASAASQAPANPTTLPLVQTSPDATEAPGLTALLHRLDSALGIDGHLL